MRAHSLAGDGIITALKMADIMIREGRSLGELVDGFWKLPQIILNDPIKEQKDFSQIPGIQHEIKMAEKRLGKTGRVLVRYSGTERLVRVMVEGEREKEIRHHAEALAFQFEENLGDKGVN